MDLRENAEVHWITYVVNWNLKLFKAFEEAFVILLKVWQVLVFLNKKHHK